MKMAFKPAPVTFNAVNKAGEPAIYITSDPSLNTLTLTLLNQSEGAIGLTGGTPVPESKIEPRGPSSLYLLFGTLLTNEQIVGMKIEAEGWIAKCFPGHPASWGLTPQSDMQIPPNGTINFTITNILATGQPRPGQLTIDYYNLGALPDDSSQAPIVVQNAPATNQQLHLNTGFLNGLNEVFVTSDGGSVIENSLTFYLSNPSPTNPIVGPHTKWGTNPPVFNLFFVYGDAPGYGALATAQQGGLFEVATAEQYKDLWSITPHVLGANPYWELRPQNHEVLGTGDGATVEFIISNIVTALDPGITMLYLQYADIPGYDDGTFGMDIQKTPGPSIMEFTAQPDNAPCNADTVKTTLTWTTDNADFVTFNSEVSGAEEFAPNGSGPYPNPITVQRGEQITITAHKQMPDREGAAGLVTATRTLIIHGVERTIVQSGLPKLYAVMVPPGSAWAYFSEITGDLGVDPYLHKMAALRRSDNSITILDLNTALAPSDGTSNRILAVCASPDGKTLYSVMLIDKSETLSIIATDTASNAMQVIVQGIPVATGTFQGNMVISSDGKLLGICYEYNVPAGMDSGIVVVDLLQRKAVYNYIWPLSRKDRMVVEWLVAISLDGKRMMFGDIMTISVVELEESPTVIVLMDVQQALNMFFVTPPVINAKLDTMYILLADDIKLGEEGVLMVVDVDPGTFRLTLGRRVTLGTLGSPGINLALVPGDRILAATFAIDLVHIIDLDTFDFYVQECGIGGDFQPVIFGINAEANEVYATGSKADFNGIAYALKLV